VRNFARRFVGANPVAFPNLASSARNLRGSQRILLVALLLAASASLALTSVFFLSDGSPVSAWWPAAGVNALVAVAVTKRYRLPVLALVSISTFIVTFAVGRPLAVSITAAIALSAQAWIVTRFSVDRHDQPRLTVMRDVVRFFVGVLLGATLTGVLVGTSIVLSVGGDFLQLSLSIIASHASAVAVIAPIALVNRLKKPMGSAWGKLAHAAVLAASIVIAFSPGGLEELSFLPVPFLVWAAFSFSMSFALAELLGTAGLIVVLMAFGGGPFENSTSTLTDSTTLLEMYVVTLTITTLLIASSRNERQRLEERNAATSRLLHEGFEQAQNGFVILRQKDNDFLVMEANSVSAELLPSSLDRTDGDITVVEDSGLHRLLARMTREDLEEFVVSGDDELPVSVTVTNIRDAIFGKILIVSIVDLRPLRAAEEAITLQLEREQAVIEELRALNQQKDDFVSSVTHELRTPITAVIGFSEELESTTLDEEQTQYVSIIQRNAERLLSVVEDVLTFSRRMPGLDATSPLEDVDVIQVISMVLDDLRHSIRDKRMTVSTAFPTEPVLVRAEGNDVTRVIINLLTNAVKFTPADGTLDLVASVVDGSIVITITDSGPGVAPGDLDKVFDRFYRSSRAAQDGVPGTGLGLSIVRDLVTLMNGSIALESDGENGTTARLILPIV